MSNIQKNDWYDLRDHIDVITPEFIRFKFHELEKLEFTEDVFNQLKEMFSGFEIERPVKEAPWFADSPYREYVSAGWVYVTLRFKNLEHRTEILKLMDKPE